MPIARLVLAGRAALLSVIITFTAPALLQLLPNSNHATAEATVAFGDSDGKNKEKDKEKREKAENEDRVINGQVLDIDTLKIPPEIVLGSVDGQTIVRVLKTDEIAKNGVHLGDYIQADGEKIHEQLFEATQLSVSSRYKGDISENDNNDK
jgi:ribosomal protein L9